MRESNTLFLVFSLAEHIKTKIKFQTTHFSLVGLVILTGFFFIATPLRVLVKTPFQALLQRQVAPAPEETPPAPVAPPVPEVAPTPEPDLVTTVIDSAPPSSDVAPTPDALLPSDVSVPSETAPDSVTALRPRAYRLQTLRRQKT